MLPISLQLQQNFVYSGVTVLKPDAAPLGLPQITKSARLEEIRLTILNNLMLYHPESTGELAWGPPATSSRDYESDSEGGGRASAPLGVRSRCWSSPRVRRA